jgi:hypothetical protein
MSKHRFKLPMLALALIASLASPVAVPAYADEEEATCVTHEGTSMTMSPTKARLQLTPSTTSEGSFTVYNTGTDDFDFTVEAMPYYVKDENYQPYFGDSIANARTTISKWITFNKTSYTLAAAATSGSCGESVEIHYTIKVPKNAPSGGQYGAILVHTKPSSNGEGGVATVKQLGYIIYAQMQGGETIVAAELLRQDLRSFYFSGPISDDVTVKNTGNVEVAVKHKLTITDFFSNQTAYDPAEAELFVLPETTRYISTKWDQAPLLGIFHVTSTITLLDEVHEVEKVVLIIPLFLIIIVLLFITLAIILIAMRSRTHKHKSHHMSD